MDRTGQSAAQWHAETIDEAAERLGVGTGGLSSDEAAERLEAVGLNELAPPGKDSAFARLLRQFNDPMIWVLIGAAAFTAILGHWVDTIVILAVVIINAVIGFIQEGRAEDALEGIRKMLSLSADVRRDGTWVEIPAEQVVPGDVVWLSAGDRVPADIRLTEVSSLRVDEAALTGESEPVDKSTDPVEADAGVGDRSSMAFSGTTVVAGAGAGIVVGTAEDTEIGRISTMLSEVESLETPLTKQMTKFSSGLAIVVVVLAVAMFGIGLLYDYSWSELVLSSIGFAVAAIPEGLPAVLTITLALGVQKMAGRNAITRRMTSVETLGSVTTICTDKTGTLTRNEMTVQAVITAHHDYEVEGTGYAPEGAITLDGDAVRIEDHAGLGTLVRIAGLANDSTVSKQNGSWALSGEPTDGALRTFAMKADFDNPQERIDSVPFDSTYKYMATLDSHEGQSWVHVKGAPDRLLDRSTTQGFSPNSSEPLDREFWEQKIDEYSSRGLRLLAAAIRQVDTDGLDHDHVEELTFVGLYAIIDPPRDEAIEAIRLCRQAGIRVAMITGDHAGTATAIGHAMGIGQDQRAVTGAELEAADDEELREIVRKHEIFARTSPEHKLRLVRAMQANGEVVSMTGDGVNDAPALKQADVGVAMGIKGTEATKDAADIVLADDNFATIEAAVEMGRTIYDNLRKAIIFMLPTNGAQGLVILTAVLLGLTLPLTPVQVLWVNMITAVTLSLALAFEPAEADIMKRPPRQPGGSILPRSGVLRIAYVSLLIGGSTIAVFVLGMEAGWGVDYARTVAVNTLVVGQIFYLLASRFTRTSSIRRELITTNPLSWVSIGVMILLQIGFVHLPVMQTAFSSQSVGWVGWLVPIGVGIAVFLVVEIEKALTRSGGRD
ncbi:cation-transporting P-type ATPase [Flaviflexus salsibiostraticola]|uniref:Cation-transporting P-type ATPase n=1 Tax=Flaviflexus salsibiostraticola TaxID=1282737 RepID=A0A3Q8WSX5_9ACTO|nr:cation-transporting P-type ATPase [Flaviflexus salsibiostraticola]AZN29329.1 cation-transporting P-type ATPase [Flaviflexus salsibiostraticola]